MSFHSKTLKIYPCSPEAAAEIESYEDKIGTWPPTVGKRRYPWNQMKIGECFIEKFEATTEFKLRASANFQKSWRGKRFIVIEHDAHKIFEVARVA